MKRFFSLLAIVLSLSLCLAVPAVAERSATASAAEGVQVTIRNSEVQQGGYVYLSLSASGVKDLSMIELALSYDPSAFEFCAASAGSLLPSDTLSESNGEEAGLVSLYALSAAGFSGDGVLWSVTLRAKDDAPVGSYPVRLLAGDCCDKSLAPVTVTTSGASITVTERPQSVQRIYIYGRSSQGELHRDDSVTVSFYSGNLYSLAAAEMEIDYDDSLLSLNGVQLGPQMLASGQASVNSDRSGYVKISYIAMNGVQGRVDPILSLTFTALQDTDAATDVTLSMGGLCDVSLAPMTADDTHVSLTLKKTPVEVIPPEIGIADITAQGDSLEVSVVAEGETHLAAGDFAVSYDPSLLVCAEATGNSSYYTVINNQKDEGRVSFSFIAVDGISEDTTLVTLTFEKVSDAPFDAEISLEGTDLADAEIKPITANVHGGTIHSTCHIWESRSAKAATCTESGHNAYEECSICGSRRGYVEETAKGHKEEIIPKKEPTCTEAGSTQGSRCSVCNEILDEPHEIPANGHTMSENHGHDATCTEDGELPHFHCTACNLNFEDSAGERQLDRIDIPALGHDMVEHERIPASCTDSGTVHHFHCNRCNKNFGDREGRGPLEGITIPAAGHRYGEPAWEWEGFTAATATFRCETCGDTQVCAASVEMTATTTACTVDNVYTATVTFLEKTYTKKKTETLSGMHSLGDWLPGRAAGCEETGERGHYVCSKCGKYLDEDGKTELENIVIPVRGHQIDFVDRQPPTCTKEGTEAYFACSECGKMFADAEGDNPIESPARIPALGHSYGDPIWEWKEDNTVSAHFSCISGDHELVLDGDCHADATTFPPTCTEDGKIIYSAIVELDDRQYSTSKEEKVEKLGHTSMPVQGKDATCTEAGLTAGAKCSVCGVTLEEQTEIPAKGHHYGDPTWEWNGFASATATFTCDQCEIGTEGHTVTQSAQAQKGSRVEPTCVAQGSQKYTVTVRFEEKEYTTEQTEALNIDSSKHTHLSLVERKDATCTDAGYEQYYQCDGCQRKYEDADGNTSLAEPKEIPAKGHLFGEWRLIEDGKEQRSCDVCGETEERDAVSAIAERFRKEVAAIGNAETGEQKFEAIKRAAETWNSMTELERAIVQDARSVLQSEIEAYNATVEEINRDHEAALGITEAIASALAGFSGLAAAYYVGKGLHVGGIS